MRWIRRARHNFPPAWHAVKSGRCARRAHKKSLAETQHEGAVVLRVEDMLPQPSAHVASALEEKVVEFEQRSDQIQASIAEIRGVLGELQG